MSKITLKKPRKLPEVNKGEGVKKSHLPSWVIRVVVFVPVVFVGLLIAPRFAPNTVDPYVTVTVLRVLCVSAVLSWLVSMRERLLFSSPPRLLKGSPVLFIHIAILGVAVYGIFGNWLAA